MSRSCFVRALQEISFSIYNIQDLFLTCCSRRSCIDVADRRSLGLMHRYRKSGRLVRTMRRESHNHEGAKRHTSVVVEAAAAGCSVCATIASTRCKSNVGLLGRSLLTSLERRRRDPKPMPQTETMVGEKFSWESSCCCELKYTSEYNIDYSFTRGSHWPRRATKRADLGASSPEAMRRLRFCNTLCSVFA
jgi:hypothetical protein